MKMRKKSLSEDKEEHVDGKLKGKETMWLKSIVGIGTKRQDSSWKIGGTSRLVKNIPTEKVEKSINIRVMDQKMSCFGCCCCGHFCCCSMSFVDPQGFYDYCYELIFFHCIPEMDFRSATFV